MQSAKHDSSTENKMHKVNEQVLSNTHVHVQYSGPNATWNAGLGQNEYLRISTDMHNFVLQTACPRKGYIQSK